MHDIMGTASADNLTEMVDLFLLYELNHETVTADFLVGAYWGIKVVIV